MIMLGPPSRARTRLHGHLWFLVLALSPHWSGRGLGPRRSSGTLQLSTRCSSLALTPSRSLAVRVGGSWLPTPSASGATSDAANPTNTRSIHATTRSGARNITRGKLGIGGPFQEDRRPDLPRPAGPGVENRRCEDIFLPP